MLFIGLDVSKISTALCIEKNGITKLYSYTTKKDNNTWVKQTSQYINYRNINYNYSDEQDYSKSEILKLNEFDTVTDLVINDIFDNIKILDSVRIGIEGFSYGSTGPIFDLIEFNTILKYTLLHKMNKYSIIEIMSPMTLKTEWCKMIYKPRIELKGKKTIKEIYHIENDKGKQATKFDKWDMFYGFIDSDIKMNFKNWCIENKENITKNKDVPKPIDDIIDSLVLVNALKIKYQN